MFGAMRRATLRTFAGGTAMVVSVALGQTQGAIVVPEVEGMVFIPAGDFLMGSPEHEGHANKDEMPQRRVYVPAFFIDQFEVSNIEYKRFVDATGYPAPPSWVDNKYPIDDDFFPVSEVSWWDATCYARWMGKRLPTETEWEKAARGTDGRRFPWGDKFSSDLANNAEGIMETTAKLEGASPFGVVNMVGNVAEWTANIYDPNPKREIVLPPELGGSRPPQVATPPAGETPSPPRDARPSAPGMGTIPRAGEVGGRAPGPPHLGLPAARALASDEIDGEPEKRPDARLLFMTQAELQDTRHRVYRGGSYNNYASFLRCANREKEKPGAKWDYIGFRCAMDPPGARLPADR